MEILSIMIKSEITAFRNGLNVKMINPDHILSVTTQNSKTAFLFDSRHLNRAAYNLVRCMPKIKRLGQSIIFGSSSKNTLTKYDKYKKVKNNVIATVRKTSFPTQPERRE